eukprot:Hpha_TRINITY_DN10624_c0_g1::TRINITY_DN10624_c0_g1_i1::g.156586::m.156586
MPPDEQPRSASVDGQPGGSEYSLFNDAARDVRSRAPTLPVAPARPETVFLLLLCLIVCVAIFVAGFSEIGYGATLFKTLARNNDAKVIAGLGLLVLCLLYVFDASYWTRDAYTEDALQAALDQPFDVVLSANHKFSLWLGDCDPGFRYQCQGDWGPIMQPELYQKLRFSNCFEREEAGEGNRVFLRVIRTLLVACSGVCCLLGALLAFKDVPYLGMCLWVVLVTLMIHQVKVRVYRGTPMTAFLIPLSRACVLVGAAWLVTCVVWVITADNVWNEETRCDFGARLRVCKNFTEYETREKATEAAVLAGGVNHLNTTVVATHDTPFVGVCLEWGLHNASFTEGLPGFCWKYGGSGRACLPGCEIDPKESACPVGESYCLASFLLWGSMFMLSAGTFVFGILIGVVGKALAGGGEAAGRLRVVVYMVITMVMIMWVAASIAGASMELATALVSLAGMGLILTVTLVTSSVGFDSLRKGAKRQPLIKKLADAAGSDAAKGLGLLLMWPFLLIFAFFSWLNQRARICMPFTKAIVSDRERAMTFTLRGQKIMDKVKEWHLASVLRWAVVWGMFHFVIRIGAGILVVLFLSWLNAKIKSLGLIIITLIFLAVGLGMFLLPPVPGIPVYLTGGILLGKIGEEEFGSFPAALVYAIIVTFILKCLAIACQQKLIGERFSDNTSVKAFVGINSMQIRAIRSILRQPGMNRNKVAVLVGGPDWPTSVLTGILRLSLGQMLIGSVPILFPLGLTVVAGACMLKTSEGGMWESLASVFQVFASLAQLGCTFAALGAIEGTAQHKRDEIMAPPEGNGEPDHEDVKKLDDELELFGKALKLTTVWRRIPQGHRILLLVAFMTGALSFDLFLFRATGDSREGNFCFEKVEVTTDIDGHPLYGDIFSLVQMPLGPASLGLLCASWIFYKVFRSWSVKEASSLQTKLDTISENRVLVTSGPFEKRAAAKSMVHQLEAELNSKLGLSEEEFMDYHQMWLKTQGLSTATDEDEEELGTKRLLDATTPAASVPPLVPTNGVPPPDDGVRALIEGRAPPDPVPRSPCSVRSAPGGSPIDRGQGGGTFIRDHVGKQPGRKLGDRIVRGPGQGAQSMRVREPPRSDDALYYSGHSGRESGRMPQQHLRVQPVPMRPGGRQQEPAGGPGSGRGRQKRLPSDGLNSHSSTSPRNSRPPGAFSWGSTAQLTANSSSPAEQQSPTLFPGGGPDASFGSTRGFDAQSRGFDGQSLQGGDMSVMSLPPPPPGSPLGPSQRACDAWKLRSARSTSPRARAANRLEGHGVGVGDLVIH